MTRPTAASATDAASVAKNRPTDATAKSDFVNAPAPLNIALGIAFAHRKFSAGWQRYQRSSGRASLGAPNPKPRQHQTKLMSSSAVSVGPPGRETRAKRAIPGSPHAMRRSPPLCGRRNCSAPLPSSRWHPQDHEWPVRCGDAPQLPFSWSGHWPTSRPWGQATGRWTGL
jgi:hypothetical protein